MPDEKKKYLATWVHATPDGEPLAMARVLELTLQEKAEVLDLFKRAIEDDPDTTIDFGLEDYPEVITSVQGLKDWLEENGGL